MINDEKKYELIKFEDGEFSLDVNVSPNEDTVWLTANEIALLFERDPKTIRKHINNVFEENEVDINSNTQKMRIAEVDQRVTFYSLDVIISVGYRVKSKRGVSFRQWANSILKQYLLNGHVINEERCLSCASNIISLQNDIKHIESKIKVIEDKVNLENSKIFYQGEILDAYTFIRKLFFLAKYEIIIVDYYADKFLLSMLKDIKTNITIITSTSSYLNKESIPTNIKIITNEDIHGRYLFIDDIGYIIDNSFNNIGKKRLLMMKLEDTKERILKDII
ncbi:MAG: virulence RhuM family protein [Acholeplasmatales bacterium]|nr:virulence RhuM family protein [Acholeplasmatales bacterium]